MDTNQLSMDDCLTCFIIDDEPLALGLLEGYVLRTPFLRLTGKYPSALVAMEAVHRTPPDVLFLDIQMADLSGMDFARMLPMHTSLIFTTAFQQYALEGYKVNALDYLLKPFSYTEFLVAANKALRWHQRQLPTLAPLKTPLSNESAEQAFVSADRAMVPSSLASTTGSLFVKADYRLIQLELGHILYVEGLKDYVKIYLDNQPKPVITHMTMKAMEERLPSDRFLRVHRSFIVHTARIKVIERNRIVFGKTYIPISDTYKAALEKVVSKSCKP